MPCRCRNWPPVGPDDAARIGDSGHRGCAELPTGPDPGPPGELWLPARAASFCRVTWSRRCSILRRRSSSSWWASEGETAARGRASACGTEGDPSCPMAPAAPAGERPAQDHHGNPAKPAGVDGTYHLDSHLSELSRRSAPIGQGSGWPADDDRSYAPGVGDCGRCAILFYCVDDMVCFETSELGSYCHPGSTQQSDRALGQGTLARGCESGYVRGHSAGYFAITSRLLAELHRDSLYPMMGKDAWVAGADRREAPGRSLCVWGVASGSAASHPDPGSSGMVEFSEESHYFRLSCIILNIVNLPCLTLSKCGL